MLLIIEKAEENLHLTKSDDLGEHLYLVDHTFLREHGATKWDLLPQPDVIKRHATPICTLDELPLQISLAAFFLPCSSYL